MLFDFKKWGIGVWILRIGLALTILWFGVSQLLNPSFWTGYVPFWAEKLFFFFSTKTIVILNGILEVVLSVFLLFDRTARISSLLLAIHLFFIIVGLGYNEIAVRDFGILTGLVSLYFLMKK